MFLDKSFLFTVYLTRRVVVTGRRSQVPDGDRPPAAMSSSLRNLGPGGMVDSSARLTKERVRVQGVDILRRLLSVVAQRLLSSVTCHRVHFFGPTRGPVSHLSFLSVFCGDFMSGK